MTITLRNTKGSALTYSELDGNFTDLDQRIDALPDSSQVSGIILADVDSAYVNARVNPANSLDSAEALVLIDDNSLDSAETIALIDSAYVQARQTDYLDSAATQSIIDSNGFLDSASAQGIIDSNGFISLATLKTEVAASADFAAFKLRIAAL